ncbi:hypothetical protein [Natrialba sp. INN-245]|uniref:hypothetical protein n=1 Tax=Natrialba sp. INN-245 TaxID=2690967 RepID=UPI0013113677|nr:hypothetical protein [Natrialba sp. INN-245]MWV38239.1 hypothetical protein [Natrialba sp. INN-245]
MRTRIPSYVSRTRCPSCLELAGEEVDRNVIDSGLERTFECDDCGHRWSVFFWFVEGVSCIPSTGKSGTYSAVDRTSEQ